MLSYIAAHDGPSFAAAPLSPLYEPEHRILQCANAIGTVRVVQAREDPVHQLAFQLMLRLDLRQQRVTRRTPCPHEPVKGLLLLGTMNLLPLESTHQCP